VAGTPTNSINISTEGVTYFNGPDFASIPNGTTGQVLTANASGAPTFQTNPADGIVTISGDSGSATGATVTIKADVAARNCGKTVQFSNSGATSTLNVNDSLNNMFIGTECGPFGTVTGSASTGLGVAALAFVPVSGNSNTAVGSNAGSNISGNFNTVLGSNSMSVGAFNEKHCERPEAIIAADGLIATGKKLFPVVCSLIIKLVDVDMVPAARVTPTSN